jgi:hypothetical protein
MNVQHLSFSLCQIIILGLFFFHIFIILSKPRFQILEENIIITKFNKKYFQFGLNFYFKLKIFFYKL